MKTKARVYEIIIKVVDDYSIEEQFTGVKQVREELEGGGGLDLGSLKIRSLKVREIK